MNRILVKGFAIAMILSLEVEAFAKEKVEEEKKVLLLDETVVEGRLKRPEAFYIMQNATFNYEKGHKREKLSPKIVGDGKGMEVKK